MSTDLEPTPEKAVSAPPESASTAPPKGDEDDTPLTIKTYAEEVQALESFEGRLAEACMEATGPMMLVFWGIAGVSDWYSWLGGLGVAIVILIATAAANTMIGLAMRAVAGETLGVLLSTGLTYGGLGLYLSTQYPPSYIGWVLAGVSAVIHTIRFAQISKDRDKEVVERHLSTRLRAELSELPEVLRPEIRTILDGVARDRKETCNVLRTSLADDGSINRFALLSGMDEAFSCLLNRAGAVNGLLDRVIDDPADPITRSAQDAFVRFKETAKGIHDIAVSLLAYAASRNSAASEALSEQIDDLAQMSAAWQELGSL